MSSAKPAHLVAIPMAAWGHVRPMLHLALNALSDHPNLHLTLLVAPSVTPRVETEIASPALAHIHVTTPNTGAAAIVNRLQVIQVQSGKLTADFDAILAKFAAEARDYAEAIPKFLAALFVPDPTLSNKFAHIKPSFITFDLFQSFVPQVTVKTLESLGQPMIPLLGFMGNNATACYNHFAPTELGGQIAHMIDRAEEEIAGGMSAEDAYAKWGFCGVGKVVSPPGLGPMYDYELYPCIGTMPMPGGVMHQAGTLYHAIRHPATTALITTCNPELEPEAVSALERILNKEVIMAGLQFPNAMWEGTAVVERGNDENDQRVLSFLDKMVKKHGKDSVFYVSLGSTWFPALRPELVTWLLDSLRAHDIPFLFAHASFFEAMPKEDLAKINSWEDSLEVKFAPQWAVLDHPATGYFVSHCGSNSTAEAIMSEKPIVAWPFAADQGEFAAYLVKWGCAIDIKQVKTFRPKTYNTLYDGTIIHGTEDAVKAELSEIWGRVRGEEGERMRENVKKVKGLVKDSWEKGGARRAMEGLSRFF